MADNISQAQHITELDFELSKIYEQFKELETATAEEARKLAELFSKNWKLDDVLKAKSVAAGLGEASGETKELADTLKKAADNQIKLNNLATTGVSTAKAKHSAEKEQTQELIKQLSAKKQLNSEETEQLNTLKQQMTQLNQQSKALTGETGQSLGAKFTNYMMYRTFGYIEQGARAAVSAVIDVENVMMEITRIMDDATYSAESYRDSLFGIGEALGRDFNETAEIAKTFAQAGYNVADSLSMTETALLALNTAELNSEQATSSLIGIMQQWGYQATELESIIDKVNMTADQNAVTSQDLVDGLLRSGAAAKNAGISFDETIGILTALGEASGRTGKEVGNALNSMISYIQRPGSLNAYEAMGITVYADEAKTQLISVLDIVKQLSEKWTGAQDAGNEALNAFMDSATEAGLMSEELAIATDTYSEYEEAVSSAAEAAEQFSDLEKRDAAQASAGVYRRNYFIALMENLGKATEVTTALQDAQGYSMQENEKYMETLTAKLNTLITSLKELAVQAADAGLMDLAKSAIDAASSLAGVIKNIGGLQNALMLVLGVLVMVKKQAIAKGIESIAVSIGTSIPVLRNYISGLKGVQSAQETTAATSTAMGTAINAALGFIGLAITAISLINMVIDGHNAKQEEAKQRIVENTEAYKEEAATLDQLIAKYEELASSETQDSGTREEIKAIQEQITELVGTQADTLDLVNGKLDEQLEKLKLITSEKAKQNLEDLRTLKLLAEEDLSEGLSQDGLFGTSAFDFNQATAAKDILGVTSGFSEWMNVSYKGLAEYLNSMDIHSALEKLREWQKGLNDLQENGEDVGNGLTYVTAAIEELEGKIEAAEAATEAYNEAFNLSVGATNDAYISGQNYAYQLKEQAEAQSEAAAAVVDTAAAIEEAAEKQAELSQQIQNAESEISSLNGVIADLNAGNDLTADQVLDLIEKYPQLASQIKQTIDGGYTLEVEALEVLRQAKIDESVTAQEAQIENTKAVMQQSAERMGQYADEVLSIKSLEEAQALLTKNLDKQEEIMRQLNSANTIGEYRFWEAQLAAIEEANGNIETLEDLYQAIDLLANSVYSGIGSGASSAASSTDRLTNSTEDLADSIEDVGDSLSEMTSQFEHFNSMGLYTIQQQIDYYEQLRQTANLTASDMMSLQSKLFSLYKQQIQEQIDLARDAAQAQIDAARDAGEAEIEAARAAGEARRKETEAAYDAEIDGIRNRYNAQISALQALKAARNQSRSNEDYQSNRGDLLDELAYWNVRTGREAVENIERIQKEIAELDKEHAREQEDYQTDLQIQALEDRRDAELDDAERRKEQALAILDSQLSEQLSMLEQARDNAIALAEQQWQYMEDRFSEANVNMIAAAGVFAPELYQKFLDFFLNPTKAGLEELLALLAQVDLGGAGTVLTGGGTGSSGSGGGSSGSGSSGGGAAITAGSTVIIKPSATNYGGQSTDVPIPDGYKGVRYTVLQIGYGGTQALIKELYSWVKLSDLVKARTGGETLADGVAMLHENEFIANSEITKGLRRLVVNPQTVSAIEGMAKQYIAGSTSNYTTMNNDNARHTESHFHYTVENQIIRDTADIELLSSAMRRQWEKDMANQP